MANLNIAIQIAAKDNASGPIGRITNSLSGLKDRGLSGLQAAGKLALTGIAAGAGLAVTAVGLIGAAAFGVSNDVQTATGEIQSALNTTTEDAANLAGIARDVWGNNFSGSISEAAGAVGLVRQQLGDLANSEMQDATENAFRLADAYGEEVPGSIGAAKALMEEFDLTQQEAFDFLAKGFQEGLDASDDFIDTIGEYSNQFSAAGFGADEFFSVLQSGQQAGVLGTDKIADAVKEMNIRLTEGGDEVSSAFDAIGLSFADVQGTVASGEGDWADYFDEIVSGINGIEDPIARQQAQVAIFGTMAEDLGVQFTDGLSTAITSLDDMAGSVDAVDARYNNLSSAAEGYKRRALLALQPIGNVLLGLANDAMPSVDQAFAFFETRIAPAIETAAGVVQGFLDNLSNGQGPLDAFIGAVEGLAPPGVVAFLTDLRDNIFPAMTAFFTENVQPVLDMVAGFVGWEDVLVGLGVVLASVIIPAAITLMGTILSIAAPIAVVIGAVALLRHAWETDFAGIRDFVGGIWDSIKQGFEAFKSLFSGDFDGFLSGIQGAWETGWNAVVTFLENLWSLVQPKLEAWYQSAVAWFEGVDWAGLAQTVMDFIVEKLGEFWSLTVSTVEEWLSSFTGWVESQDWQALGFTVTTNIIDALKEFWTNAVPTVQGWWDSISDWFAEIDWGSLGESAIDGIVVGLQNAGTAILDALSGIIDGAIAAIMAEWGINSPSTRTAQIVGMPLGQGVEVGWTQALEQAQFERPLERAMTLPTTVAGPQVRTAQPVATQQGGVGERAVHIHLIRPQFHGVKDVDSLIKQLQEYAT